MAFAWKDYEVHDVAGVYYLVNVAQSGKEYIPPYRITGSGAMICRGMIEGRSVDQIVGDFVREFDIMHSQARSDITAFLEALDEKDR